jgi:hypothetical protein
MTTVGYTHTEDHRIVRVRGKSESRPIYRATFTYPGDADQLVSRIDKFFKRKREAVEWLARMDAETSK